MQPVRLAVLQKIFPLKRFLLIFNDRIFDSRVDRGIPSLVAAPEGPYTRPPHSRKAASMMAFSSAGFLPRGSGGFPGRGRRLPGKPTFVHRKFWCFIDDDGALNHVL